MQTETDFVRANRQRLYAQLPAGSLIILQSNDLHPTNADGAFPYKPNHDLYYLTGIREQGCFFMAFPDYYRQEWREVLFLPPHDPVHEQWMGARLSPEQAASISGINLITDTSRLQEFLRFFMVEAHQVWLSGNEHPRRETSSVLTSINRFAQNLQLEYPAHLYARLSTLLHPLRMMKQPFELEQMKKAIAITGMAFQQMATRLQPGKTEYQAEADFYHAIRYEGAGWADYQPIVAGGKNACTLHYHANNAILEDGTLLLVDAAAAFELYQSDITRVFPVNGRFSARQKQVYEAVLKLQNYISERLRPGKHLPEVFGEYRLYAYEVLRELGLGSSRIKEQEAIVAQYTLHNPSHYLGLDVHDVGLFSIPLQAGTVLTNEPGIYIPEEGIGIRLENNMLISETGAVNLSAGIPILPEAVEEMMRGE